MAKQDTGGLGGAIALIAVGFLIGRCSAPSPAPPAIDNTPATFADAPAPTYNTPPVVTDDIEPVPMEAEQFAPLVQPRAQRSYEAPTYFRNCSAARAAGAAPVREGDPGYAPHLDRDSDGVGCE